MKPNDTNVKAIKKLHDGAEIVSLINGGDRPYIVIQRPDGSEEGSLEVREGTTAAGRALEAVIGHYDLHRRRATEFKSPADIDAYIGDMLADISSVLSGVDISAKA